LNHTTAQVRAKSSSSIAPRLPAVESILGSVNAPVIPIHLDGVRGSIFSSERGRFSFQWPRRIPYSVTATVGAPRT